VKDQDVVYHAAGATKALARRALYEVNEHGTHNVAAACAQAANPPVLVYVSSLAACGPSKYSRPRRETDPPEPVSEYGRSKLAGERAMRKLADRVPSTIVRPAIVFGPADVDGLAMFRTVKRWGTHLTPGSDRHRYSIIHVTDLCRLILLAAQRGRRVTVDEAVEATRARGCYFGCGNQYLTWTDLGEMVGAAVGRRRVLALPVPHPCVRPVAATAHVVSHIIRRPLYLNWDKAREIAAGSWTCSGQAAADELDFTIDTPLAERLEQTAAWYREAGWL
jgi:nucleoside-diphosphate-sugar epimerase